MPFLSVDAMCTKVYTTREWVTYYKNIWVRNLAARIIDVKTDEILKAKNPDMATEDIVQTPQGPRAKLVKERLEERKLSVQDAVDILAGIEAVLALSDDEIAAASSEEALKVAEDMLPKAAEEVKTETETPVAAASEAAPAAEEKKDDAAPGAEAATA